MASDVVGDGLQGGAQVRFQWVFQALIDAEATAAIGAEPHPRSDTRVAQRNGYRDPLVTTAAGDWSCGSQSCAPGR